MINEKKIMKEIQLEQIEKQIEDLRYSLIGLHENDVRNYFIYEKIDKLISKKDMLRRDIKKYGEKHGIRKR